MYEVHPWFWAVFGGALLVALLLDLFLHRGDHADTHKAAVGWAIFWVALGLVFGVFVWFEMGGKAAEEYYAAYLIEKSLSVDNLFVFLIIFQSLKIPTQNQRTVLSWGIFGALVFRALFIFLGVAAIERWDWVVYIFAGILIYAAVKIFIEDPAEQEENRAIAWLSQHLPLTHKVHGNHFTAVVNGKRVATPLLIAVLGLEATDILFAVDSVPAAFAVSRDRFILYTSNAFAILGLRSLYIVLAKIISDLKYLHYGLSLVLGFAGVKLLIAELPFGLTIAGHEGFHIPASLSIGLIVVFIGGAVWASLVHRKRHGHGGEKAREG